MDKFDVFFFEEKCNNGQCIIDNVSEWVRMSEYDDFYEILSEPKSTEMICSLKTYYVDTLTLMTTGEFLKKGNTEIGVWTTYDRFGQIMEKSAEKIIEKTAARS